MPKVTSWKSMKYGPKKKKAYKKKTARKAPISRIANRMIPSVNGTEYKYIDVENYGVIIPYTGSLVLLNGLIQGTTAISRIGNKIRMKTLDINLRIYTAQKSRLVRYMIVLDTQPKGAAPTLSNILEDLTYWVGPNVLSQRQKKSIERFVILKNKSFVINDVVTTSGQQNETLHHENLKLNIGVDYGLANTGAIADISVNSIYLVSVSTDASTGVVMDYASRIRFTDD